ncbi:MAG: hypothetical protein A2V67_13825 [Deltaproteobacteria bacterium RBG_13_61_14]|nr:MAG: hypothetical protein A2V67_13825 [Deltaproteobacteria bacterium RBG_13_61_14]
MTPEQILNRLAHRLESSSRRKTAALDLYSEPRDLLEEYFSDIFRPRLSGNAFLVWSLLLHRADPESRIASLSHRDIKLQTGIRSNRGLHRALHELAHYGYCILSNFPTGPGMPRNYKIPEHIGTRRFPHLEAMRLCVEADRPRKRGQKAARILREAAREFAQADSRTQGPGFDSLAPGSNQARGLGQTSDSGSRVGAPAPLSADGAPANPMSPSRPPAKAVYPDLPQLDLPDLEHLNLDQEIERLEKEVEEIGKALSKKESEDPR